jgi:hypothetical protein
MVELATSGHTYAPAPLGGRRRSAKKLRLVKKKTVRRMLAKQGLKMRGGGADPSPAAAAEASSGPAPMGGRRHRKSHRKSHRRRKSLFGMRF